MIGKSAEVEIAKDPEADFQVRVDADGMVKRLRAAISRIGTVEHVAALANVPKGTVDNLLTGTMVRWPVIFALAAACKVSLDWLATGIGSEHPEWFISPKTTGSSSVAVGPVLQLPDYAKAKSDVQARKQPVLTPAQVVPEILEQAIEIVAAFYGENILEMDRSELAEKIAKAYNVLIGSKS